MKRELRELVGMPDGCVIHWAHVYKDSNDHIYDYHEKSRAAFADEMHAQIAEHFETETKTEPSMN